MGRNRERKDEKKVSGLLRLALIGGFAAIGAVGYNAAAAQIHKLDVNVVNSRSTYVERDISKNMLRGAIVPSGPGVQSVYSTALNDEFGGYMEVFAGTLGQSRTFVVNHIAGSVPGERIKVKAGNKEFVVEQVGKARFLPGQKAVLLVGSKKSYGVEARLEHK